MTKKDNPVRKNTSSSAVPATKKKNLPSEKEIFFEKIFHESDLGVAILEPSLKIIKVNKTFENMLGYTEDELKNMSSAEVIHPHDVTTDKRFLKELISGKRQHYSFNKRYITKSGSILYAKVTRFLVKRPGSSKKTIFTIIEDLTAHHQITNELSSNQYLFTALLDNIPDSIYFKDLDSRFIKVNRMKALNHGVPDPSLLIGKTDFDFFSKEHATEALNDEQEIIKTGEPILEKEEKLEWPDGRTTWVLTSKIPFRDVNGKIIGTFGITRDITSRKQSEEQLRLERILMRTVFDNLPDAIYAKDLNYRKTFANKSDLKNMQCEKEEDALGKTDYDFFSKEEAEKFIADDKAVIELDKPVINREEFFLDADNNEHWLLTSKLPLRDEDGKVTGLVGIGHDITDRKKSERVREVLYLISEAANSASDMQTLYQRIHEIIQSLFPAKNLYIALYDEKSDMLSFPYFVDEFDPPMPPKKLGKGLTEYVLKTGEAILVDAKKDLELRESGKVELIGTPQAIWLGIPLKLGGKTIGVLVVQDYENEKAFGEDEMQLLTFVSEQIAQAIQRKRSSDEIKMFAEELRQLNQTKDKFFSIIAHDLKNPFITIMGFSDLLISDYKELSEDEKLFYIEEMKKSAELSHSLLQNLLQWSRSQTGRIEFNPQRLCVKDIIGETIELLKVTAERKQIKISCNVDEGLFVMADEDMLNTILRNLVTNALKFTNKEGAIKINTASKNGFVEITVADSGVGMDSKTRDGIFRLDVSHSTHGTENETGTGLGLILCKEFVEKNGGRISVESAPGKGSAFTFTLPDVS